MPPLAAVPRLASAYAARPAGAATTDDVPPGGRHTDKAQATAKASSSIVRPSVSTMSVPTLSVKRMTSPEVVYPWVMSR